MTILRSLSVVAVDAPAMGREGPARPRGAGTSMAPVGATVSVRCFASISAMAHRARRRRWRPGSTASRARGIEAHALELPKRKAEDAVAAYEAQVPDEPGVVVGGHSFGGRVASLAVAGVRVAGAAARVHPYAGLVCLSYPMHRAGRARRRPRRGPRTGRRSTSRRCCCRGRRTRSPGSSCSRPRCRCSAAGTLVTYPNLGHGLLPVREDALDRIAAFIAGLRTRGPRLRSARPS